MNLLPGKARLARGKRGSGLQHALQAGSCVACSSLWGRRSLGVPIPKVTEVGTKLLQISKSGIFSTNGVMKRGLVRSFSLALCVANCKEAINAYRKEEDIPCFLGSV